MSNERRRQGPRGPMGHGMRGNGEKAKNFKGTLKKLFVYLKPYYFKLAVVIIFAVGSTIFTIVGPKILAKATDKLSEGIVEIVVCDHDEEEIKEESVRILTVSLI